MKIRGQIVTLLMLMGLCALVLMRQSASVEAQSGQTVSQIVFSAQAIAATSANVRNIGQSSHIVVGCFTAAAGTLNLEGSFDGTNWVVMRTTAVSATPACQVLEAGGYFPRIRLNLVSIGAGTLTAWYSGSVGPIPGTYSTISAAIASPLAKGGLSVFDGQFGGAFNQNSGACTAVAGNATCTFGGFRTSLLYSITAFCSAGTATLTLTDPTLGTVWASAPGAVGTSTFFIAFPTPYTITSTLANVQSVTLSSCGGGNTGSVYIQASATSNQ